MTDALTPYRLDRSGPVPSLVPDYAASRAIAAQIIASERAHWDRPSLATRIAQRAVEALCRRRSISSGRRQSQPPAQGRGGSPAGEPRPGRKGCAMKLQTVGDLLDEMDAEAGIIDMPDISAPIIPPAPGPATDGPLVTAPGMYPDIAIEDYHGREICPRPSISATGLHTLRTKSPLHYWFDSPLNPERPAPEQRTHFNIGKAVHDRLLLGERWPEFYHVLPDGFSRAKTKAMADEIAEADAAQEAGLTLLRAEDAATVEQVVAAVNRDPLLRTAFANGLNERTIAWQDAETGVWLRCRPDSMTPDKSIILDIKTTVDASPATFQRSASKYGYLSAAAHYLDGLAAVTSQQAQFWIVAIEKTAPFAVATYQLDADDIARVDFHYVRPAVRLFADCLAKNDWPSWPHQMLGLPAWESRQLDYLESKGNYDEH